MSTKPDLSILDLAVLGNVWKKAGCTVDEVVAEFATSTAAHYRSGAGTIRALMTRLKKRGYLRSRQSARGYQRRHLYSITPRGRTALRNWLRPPLPDEEFMVTPDMLRTRVYFLHVLTPAQRRKFLDHAHERLRTELQENLAVLRQYRQEGNYFGELAKEGAVAVMRARISWIEKVRRELAADEDDGE